MIVKATRIRNFRSLRDVSLTFGRQTVLVGGNGAGKSSILRAIELFYAPSLTHLRDIDFFDRTQPIEIELTFTAFTDAERDLFDSRISADEMTVVRVVEPGGGKNNGRYFGMTALHPGFKAIWDLSGMSRRAEFNGIPREGIYADLATVKKVDEIEGVVAAWEAAHPEHCERDRDNGQFLGFANVGRGALQKATSFVLIPAVRDASADAQDGKNTVIGQLMELIVRSAIQSRKDIQEFQKEISERYAKLTDPANLPELGGLANVISDTLGQLYANVAVALHWKPSDTFAVPLPGADVGLHDEDIEIPVDRAGHGLQRAFVIALLQHLARARAVEQQVTEGEVNGETEKGQEPVETGLPLLPGLILAIEEPELYQHPTKQRHFARVLSRLSHGLLPGMATTTQLMFATHSPYFVAMDRFDEIRILRRVRPEPDARRESVCSAASLATVVTMLEKAADKPPGTFTIQSVKPRLHIIDTELTEGFFAKAIVLVEGPSDKAALIAAAALDDRRFEAEGIAVLPVGGKDNLDKPWAIFTSLGIPTYVMWDSDSSKTGKDAAKKAASCNRLLQRLLSVPGEHVDFPANVTDAFACFEDELECTLQAELGAEIYTGLLEKMVAHYDLPKRDDALKNPEVMSQVLREAATQGAKSQTLTTVVDRIFAICG